MVSDHSFNKVVQANHNSVNCRQQTDNKINLTMNVFVVLILFLSSQVYCSAVQLQEARVKRAVFDLIPPGVVSGEEDRTGSVCECSDGTFYCVRDAHLLCRRILSGLASMHQDEQLQVVERLDHRIRKKNR